MAHKTHVKTGKPVSADAGSKDTASSAVKPDQNKNAQSSKN
ncbi:MAG: hypothetical protein WCR02_04655 [Sphaerochaetaceae bacterium]